MKENEMASMIETLSQVRKPPFQLVSAVTGLYFATSLQPAEIPTDDSPPGWEKRDEIWTIEELLGLYDSRERRIVVFNKGIEHVAQQLKVKPFYVENIVRIHEWGHANFHVGVTQAESAKLAKASLDNEEASARKTSDELTRIYSLVEPYVHEQIAQSITFLALERLLAEATTPDAKQACSLLLETFKRLTLRQPPQYQLGQLQNLGLTKLQNRLISFIDLVRGGDIQGHRKTWNTIMSW